MGADYLKDIVFLGDSTTYGMRVYATKYVSDDQIFTGSGGTLDLSEIATKKIVYPQTGVDFNKRQQVPIGEAIARKKPKILIITLGINFSAEANGWDDAKLKKYFQKQISDLYQLVMANSPSTKVVFQTIYPTIDSKVTAKSLKNERVDLRNTWLLEKCEELNISVLWSHNYMGDENGQLKAAFNTYHGDGIHLNPDGFAAVLEFCRTHAVG